MCGECAHLKPSSDAVCGVSITSVFEARLVANAVTRSVVIRPWMEKGDGARSTKDVPREVEAVVMSGSNNDGLGQ